MSKKCSSNVENILTITEKIQKMLSETAEDMLELSERLGCSSNDLEPDDKELVRAAAMSKFIELQRGMKISFAAGDDVGINHFIGELRDIVEICK